MTPTDMLPVLLGIVLRVQNEQIDAANELNQFLIRGTGEFGGARFLLGVDWRWS